MFADLTDRILPNIFPNVQNFFMTGGEGVRDIYVAGQAGAMGPSSHAEDITFNQIWEATANKVDLEMLVNELHALREELKKESREPEQEIAIGEVAKAEKAAKEGNGAQVIKHLNSAGKWALDVATKIGSVLAAEVIKKSLGM